MSSVGNFFLHNEIPQKRRVVRELFDRAEALLSPMAGVTDMVFRRICREMGADLTYCEFASAEGVIHGNRSTRELIELDSGEQPVGIQLFGSDPAKMAAAARQAERLGPDLIDLNFGCPVKKVVKRNGGSALLCNLPLMEEIVRAVVEATSLPVTAKTRLGWSRQSLNYLETLQMLEESGVCALTMHGRTRDQKFTGIADWEPIAALKAGATIPIIGNGDVWSAEDYLRMKRDTGCDAVMIARAAIGNPFLFEEIAAIRKGRPYEPPSVRRIVDVLIDHLDQEIALKGSRTGMNRMKKHFAGYLRGHPHVAELRADIFALQDRDEVVAMLRRYQREHGNRRGSSRRAAAA